MPEIQTIGETLSFFDKKFSHAVNKKPVDGDFRVQSLFGGQYTLVQPTTTLIEKPKKLSIHFQTIYCMPVDGIS
jgi:hypothetical protein